MLKDQKEVLSRYQTQKRKLLDLGLGNVGRTDDEIMYKLGYYKVYIQQVKAGACKDV